MASMVWTFHEGQLDEALKQWGGEADLVRAFLMSDAAAKLRWQPKVSSAVPLQSNDIKKPTRGNEVAS